MWAVQIIVTVVPLGQAGGCTAECRGERRGISWDHVGINEHCFDQVPASPKSLSLVCQAKEDVEVEAEEETKVCNAGRLQLHPSPCSFSVSNMTFAQSCIVEASRKRKGWQLGSSCKQHELR